MQWTDMDTAENSFTQMRLLETHPPTNAFELQPTGELYLRSELDYERAESYELLIEACNCLAVPRLSATGTIHIRVLYFTI